MNVTTVLFNVALLVPLSCLLWWLILPRKTSRALPLVFWLVPLAICVVPLGGFLSAMIALSFGEQLTLAPFSWIDRPFIAAKVILACGLVGGFFSYGLTHFATTVLRRNTSNAIGQTKPQL